MQRQCTTTTPVVLGSLFDSISLKLETLSEEKLAIVSSHSWHRCGCGEWRERQSNRQLNRQTDNQLDRQRGKSREEEERRRKGKVWLANRLEEMEI